MRKWSERCKCGINFIKTLSKAKNKVRSTASYKLQRGRTTSPFASELQFEKKRHNSSEWKKYRNRRENPNALWNYNALIKTMNAIITNASITIPLMIAITRHRTTHGSCFIRTCTALTQLSFTFGLRIINTGLPGTGKRETDACRALCV